MNKVCLKDNLDIKKDISPLFLSAFPSDERPPEKYFYKHALENEENNIIAYYEDDAFIGFCYLTLYKDICYIFFLAVSPSLRNKGYGSKILQDIKDTNKDKVLMLCFEEVDTKYPDYNNRLKRRDFYYRNGFKDNELKTYEYGVIFDTGYIGKHKVTFQEYKEVFKLGFGPNSIKHLREVK